MPVHVNKANTHRFYTGHRQSLLFVKEIIFNFMHAKIQTPIIRFALWLKHRLNLKEKMTNRKMAQIIWSAAG